MDTLITVWHHLVSVQHRPAWWLCLLAAGAALAVVVPRGAWPVTRNVVTIAHEGGHALTAFLTGRRLAGIRLHSDTSGVTVSAGKPTGLGMILTAFAGYVAPSLLGVGAAALLAHGRVATLLWTATLLLAAMFVLIRNVYGALAVAVAGGMLFAVSWWTPASVQSVFALLLMWVLVLSGPRPVWELHHKRREGLAGESDADQLAHLTGIPGGFWVLVFAVITLGAVLETIRLLLIG